MMSCALRQAWLVGLRMASRAPAALAALALLAACGGSKPGDSAAAGAPDSAVSVPVPASDTRSASPAGSPDSNQSTGTAPAPKPKPAPKKAPDNTATATTAPRPRQDTASAAAAPSRDSSTGGTSQPAEAPLRDAYHQAPRDTVSQATYNGWKQFNLNCARCHGEDVTGTTIAPHLILSLKPEGPINTEELFIQTVCAGRPAKGMPSWCALGMDMEKINQIYGYVKGRSDGEIHPGRPAVKPEG